MMRLLVIAALAVLAYRMFMGRWPWEKRLSRQQRALVDARRLLEVGPEAGRTEILAAHRRKLASVHPDRGGSAPSVHKANEARDLLLAELPRSSLSDPKEPS
jgi:hypothetical protein